MKQSSVARLSLATLLFAVLLGSACSSSSPTDKPSTPSTQPVTKTVGASGGTVTSSDNTLTVTVPAGATDGDVDITVTPIAAPVAGAIGQVFEIGPTGTRFNQPVTLEFRYVDADLGGSPPSAFAASTVVGGGWQAISAALIDPNNRTIAGTTMHLSPYGIARLAQTEPADGGGHDAGTLPDADVADTGKPDCTALNQGKGITEAKAAEAALRSEFEILRDCSASNSCIEHKTPAGSCFGISAGTSTTKLDAARETFGQKLAALTPAESQCYAPVEQACGAVFNCVSGKCQ